LAKVDAGHRCILDSDEIFAVLFFAILIELIASQRMGCAFAELKVILATILAIRLRRLHVSHFRLIFFIFSRAHRCSAGRLDIWVRLVVTWGSGRASTAGLVLLAVSIVTF
jgi:hypothetical protein